MGSCPAGRGGRSGDHGRGTLRRTRRARGQLGRPCVAAGRSSGRRSILSPSNNTFPALPSHPQRLVGWATLALPARTWPRRSSSAGTPTSISMWRSRRPPPAPASSQAERRGVGTRRRPTCVRCVVQSDRRRPSSIARPRIHDASDGSTRADPVRPDDATDMVEVLADKRLYAIIGRPAADRGRASGDLCATAAGRSSTQRGMAQLDRRLRADGQGVGIVQATIVGDRADIATGSSSAPSARPRLRDRSRPSHRGWLPARGVRR